MSSGGGGGGEAPDVVGAAEAQGKQARLLNQEQTMANRPNQHNAWGSNEWNKTTEWDEASGTYIDNWDQTETLNPKLQASLEAQQNVGLGRSELGQAGMARVWDDMNNPVDFDQYGDPNAFEWDGAAQRKSAEDASYGRQTSRLDPQFEQERQRMESKLRNQGLSPGDQAWDAAMGNQGRKETDAYEQARMGSTLEGRAESEQGFGQAKDTNRISNELRTQQISEDLKKRGYSLEEVNRLLQGQQITGGPPASGGTTETISSKALGGG